MSGSCVVSHRGNGGCVGLGSRVVSHTENGGSIILGSHVVSQCGVARSGHVNAISDFISAGTCNEEIPLSIFTTVLYKKLQILSMCPNAPLKHQSGRTWNVI